MYDCKNCPDLNCGCFRGRSMLKWKHCGPVEKWTKCPIVRTEERR